MNTVSTSVTAVDITPEIAEQYLLKNTHNRTIRMGKVAQYAEDMRDGRWAWNGSTIVFNTDGRMDDGQHRCLAVIESGCTVKMLVVEGAEPDAQDTIDTGINRKLHDVLKLRGEQNWVALSAAIRSVHAWQHGAGSRRIGSRGSISNPQLLHTLENNPWIRDVMPLFGRVSTHSHLPITVSASLYFAFSGIDPEDCEFFFDKLGGELAQDIPQPIFMLRKALTENRDNVKGTRNITYLAALSIKAWNAYRAGEEINMLRWRAGGAKPESFPEPK